MGRRHRCVGSAAGCEPRFSVPNRPEGIHHVFGVFDNTIPIVDYYLCIHFDPTPEKIQIVRFKPAPYNPYRWAKSDSDHFRRSDPWSARDFDADVVPRSAPWEMNTTKGSPVRSGRKFAISKLA